MRVIEAFILIQTHVGTGARVRERVAALERIVRAELVTGPYDVIARAETASLGELETLVLRPIQEIPGVTHTMTCPILNAAAFS